MSIIDTAKSVVGLAAEVGKMDLHKQAVELMAQVTEQQQRIMQLTEDLAASREQLRMKSAFVFEKNAYWSMVPRGDDPTTKDQVGPYCSRCFDVLGKAVRMHDTHLQAPKVGPVFACPECKKSTGKVPWRMSQRQNRNEES